MTIRTLTLITVSLYRSASAQELTRYQVNTISTTQEDSAYSIKCDIPRVEGLKDTVVQRRCNEYIDTEVSDYVERFRGNALNAFKELSGDPHFLGSYLDLSNLVSLATDNILSISFHTEGFVEGTAHPSSESSSIIIDMRTGQLVTLADLFEPESHFLDTLSRICIADIFKDRGDSTFSDSNVLTGASPDPNNYRSFTLDQESLTIMFDEYQIASRVDAPGGYTVNIPYSALKSILRKNGPIQSLVK